MYLMSVMWHSFDVLIYLDSLHFQRFDLLYLLQQLISTIILHFLIFFYYLPLLLLLLLFLLLLLSLLLLLRLLFYFVFLLFIYLFIYSFIYFGQKGVLLVGFLTLGCCKFIELASPRTYIYNPQHNPFVGAKLSIGW